VKRTLVTVRVLLLPIISLMFFGVILWQWPAPADAQSGVSYDLKDDRARSSSQVNQSMLMSAWRL
jgi:hypothetical protein